MVRIEDSLKEIADRYMVDYNFTPVRINDIMNSDAIASMYKCPKKQCKHPYVPIIVSGLELMQNANDTLETLKKLITDRCSIAVQEHEKCHR